MRERPSNQLPDEVAWYCVQTKPKSEHIAEASLLRLNDPVEVYCPYLRIQRVLPKRKAWFTEALFPCYVFARFNPFQSHRAVGYANGVARILAFGGSIVRVPDSVIEAVRAEMQGERIREVKVAPSVGEEVEMAAGPLKGLQGIITQSKLGSDRVKILIEILGNSQEVDVPVHAVRSRREDVQSARKSTMRI